MNKLIYLVILSLFGHYYLYSQSEIKTLQHLIEIGERKDRLNLDQINDLMFTLQQNKLENEYIKNSGYVAGVLDSMSKPDYYSAIWHDGYNRGTETQKSLATFTDK